MSYDEWDAAQDAYFEGLVDEFYKTYGPEIGAEAIASFQDERLQSYFVTNPRVIEPALRQLENARKLDEEGYNEAAIVFAASAVEVGLKQALFRPIVYGLVHFEPAAVIIAELSLGHTAIERFKGLLLDILGGYLKLDLRKYVHTGASKPLWEEIKESQEHRNAIIHRGEQRSSAEVDIAIRCASAVVETLFPSVLAALGLHIHGGVSCLSGKAA
jgi:hypothetical protein